MTQKVLIMKDDYDQTTVCVVQNATHEQALILTSELYPNTIDGELYIVEADLVDGSKHIASEPEAK